MNDDLILKVDTAAEGVRLEGDLGGVFKLFDIHCRASALLYAPEPGDPLVSAESTLEHLAVVFGAGDQVLPVATELLDSTSAKVLADRPSAAHGPILSRVTSCLTVLGMDPEPQVRRAVQRQLSELLVKHQSLMHNRIMVRPKLPGSREFGPISHVIGNSPMAEFPRTVHGGQLLSPSRVAVFAGHPLTRISMRRLAPEVQSIGNARMQGKTFVASAFGTSSPRFRPGLIASLVEMMPSFDIGFDKAIATVRPDFSRQPSARDTGIREALALAVLRSAGFQRGRSQELLKYAQLNPTQPEDDSGLLGAIAASGLGSGVADLLKQRVEFMAGFTGDAPGLADAGQRVDAIVRLIAEVDPFKDHHVAADWLLECALGAPENFEALQEVLDAGVVGALLPSPGGSSSGPAAARSCVRLPIPRFRDAGVDFAQRFIRALEPFGITTADVGAKLAWCQSDTADGWRMAIDIIEAGHAMQHAISISIANAQTSESPKNSPTAQGVARLRVPGL